MKKSSLLVNLTYLPVAVLAIAATAPTTATANTDPTSNGLNARKYATLKGADRLRKVAKKNSNLVWKEGQRHGIGGETEESEGKQCPDGDGGDSQKRGLFHQ